MFADPISKTLSFNCTYVECSGGLPAMYELENDLTLCANPIFGKCKEPERLNPSGGSIPLFLGKKVAELSLLCLLYDRK